MTKPEMDGNGNPASVHLVLQGNPGLELHYSVDQVAEIWAISRQSVRRLFEDEPGVLKISMPTVLARKNKPKVMLRIPASVLARLHEQRSAGFRLKVQRRGGGV